MLLDPICSHTRVYTHTVHRRMHTRIGTQMHTGAHTHEQAHVHTHTCAHRHTHMVAGPVLWLLVVIGLLVQDL